MIQTTISATEATRMVRVSRPAPSRVASSQIVELMVR